MGTIGSPIYAPDYHEAMAEFRLEDMSYFIHTHFAFNPIIPTGQPKVLANNLDIIDTATPRQMSFVSTSANDAYPAGTGIRQILFDYFNGDWEEVFEIIYMNGTTEVNSVGTDVLKIQYCQAMDVGALNGAAGTITVSNVPADGTLYAEISQWRLGMERCAHYVAPGTMSIIPYCFASARTDGGVNLIVTGEFDYSAFGGASRIDVESAELELAHGGSIHTFLRPPARLDARGLTEGLAWFVYAYATSAANQDAAFNLLTYDYYPDY